MAWSSPRGLSPSAQPPSCRTRFDARPPHTETGLANRPLHGTAPRLPQGLNPEDVAEPILAGIINGEQDLPSTAFG